jgi:hypothetical protein
MQYKTKELCALAHALSKMAGGKKRSKPHLNLITVYTNAK